MTAGPTPRTMSAVVLTAPGRVETRAVPVPSPGAGEALVRTAYVGLCGTDLELLHGTAEYLRDGRAAYPHVPGHEWSGVVVRAPHGSHLREGEAVVGRTMVPCEVCRDCRGGRDALCAHMRETGLYGLQGAAAEYVCLPASALVPVGEGADLAQMAMVEPAVTAVEGLARTGLGVSDRVAVVGTGTIGLIAVQLAALGAARVDALAVDADSGRLAGRLGAGAVIAPEKAPSRGYDVVVEASGSSEGMRTALRVADRGGRIAAIGVTEELVDAVPAARITLDGLSLLGVRHGLHHYDHVLDLVQAQRLRLSPLIGATLPPERAREAMARLEGVRARPKVLLDFTGSSKGVQ